MLDFYISHNSLRREEGRLRKMLPIMRHINRVLTILKLRAFAANYVLHLPAHISSFDWPV
jgi:hypothetical protein